MGPETCAVYGYGFQLSDEDIVDIYAKFMSRRDTSDSEEREDVITAESSDSEDEYVEYPEDMLSFILSCISEECNVSMNFRKDNIRNPTYYIFFEDLAVEACGVGMMPCTFSSRSEKSNHEGATTSDSLIALIGEKHIKAMKYFNRAAIEPLSCSWNMYVYIC